MTDIRRIGAEEIIGHFAELEDPRPTINRQHPPDSMVVIALMAILAGAAGPTAIAKWAAPKEEFLVRALDSPSGVPRKDVSRRVLPTLKPAAFQACFADWLQASRAAAASASDVRQPVLAVDGKTAGRSQDRKSGPGALHSVGVWASAHGLSLGRVACADKSVEITAIPESLRLVDLKGTIITIDAMGAREAIAARIIEGEADDVPALRGNRETRHQAVVDHILERWEDHFAGDDARRHQTRETGHGRDETRSTIKMPVPRDLPGLESRKVLKSIGGPLLGVRQEDQPAALVDGLDELRPRGLHSVQDRARGVDQEPVRLRAGQEEDALAQASPAIGHEVPGRPEVVGQEDRVGAHPLRLGQHLRPRPPRVRRVFGVRVEDGPIISQARQLGELPPRPPDASRILVRRL